MIVQLSIGINIKLTQVSMGMVECYDTLVLSNCLCIRGRFCFSDYHGIFKDNSQNSIDVGEDLPGVDHF